MFLGTAIDFPAGDGNGYDVTTPANLAGGAGWAFTSLMWLNLDTLNDSRRWYRKSGNLNLQNAFADTNDVAFSVGRATTGADAVSSDNFFTAGKWWFVACTYDESDGPRIFHGDLTTTVVEASSYATRDVGSGDTVSTSSDDLNLGYRASLSRTLDGRVAYYHFIDARLSLGQIKGLQFQSARAVANTQILMYPGIDGSVTTITDYSGNGNDAAQVGTGQAVGVGPGALSRWGEEVAFGTVTAAVPSIIPQIMHHRKQLVGV